LKPLRLLLVEDQEDDALLLLNELERLGYEVSHERVQTREELAAALEREWDVIVSDYSLPRFDALRALQLRNERKPELPFVIVSGTISEEEAVESMRLGADDFITKQRMTRLGPAVRRALREHAELRARRSAEERLRQAQKMEAIGLLAGGVAHDFNNLLGVIQGYGELLLKQHSAEGRQRERIEHILRAAARGAALTRQLLTFSRQQPMELRVLELAPAVSGIESLLGRLIGENIEISIAADGRRGRVRADPNQVEQIVMNLAINARDAMPEGGRLVLETSSVDLDEGYAASHPDARAGPHVLLAVSDTGTGMGPETLSHIFEPFFTTKEAGRGTGLGLATVYGIVRQSGGHVAVYSELGRGTSFKIFLPRVEEAAGETANVRPSALPTTGTETVLLLEDEAALRDVIADQLRLGGYSVVSGDSAEAALLAAERHPGPIHLLLTDLVMPAIGGREAASRVRAARPGVRVLYMSGYATAAAGLHGPIGTGRAFLPKPFSLDTLLRKVREALDAQETEGGG
jgi:signal transduction histidine kinase